MVSSDYIAINNINYILYPIVFIIKFKHIQTGMLPFTSLLECLPFTARHRSIVLHENLGI